jgi:hypothetical protein
MVSEMTELSVDAVAGAIVALIRVNHGKREPQAHRSVVGMRERFGEGCD